MSWMRGARDPPYEYAPADCWWWEAGARRRTQRKPSTEARRDTCAYVRLT